MITIGETEPNLQRATSRRLQARPRPALLRVLLAEDDADLRTFLAESLRFCGYDVRAVENGFELVHVLSEWILGAKKHPPVDVLVTDVRMPGFDGLSIVESMSSSEWRMPTVLISAGPRVELRLGNLQQKNVIFLQKPIWLPDLERSIRSLARC